MTETVRRHAPPHPGRRGFAALLAANAAGKGDHVAFRFLARAGAVDADLTWAELFEAAGRQAGALHDFRGRQVGLLCNRPRDFVVSLAAIFLARAVAVPMPATLSRRSSEHIGAIISAADLAAIIAPADVLAADWLTTRMAPTLSRLPLEDLRNHAGVHPDQGDDFDVDLPLILQFTSGSTGRPKGVALSQSNLLANCEAIVEAYQLGPEDIGLSWLPLHHDMGLVGHVLVPIFLGGRSVIMDPLRFLQKPLSWLEAIGRERATITSAPNFAYELCNLAASSASGPALDLAGLATAVCGGEPVLPETLDGFVENFARFGFRQSAFAPSYGLAESALLVSTGKNAYGPAKLVSRDGPHAVRSFIDLGNPVAGMRVRIVDPVERRECTEREIGEIEIAGTSVGQRLDHERSEWTPTGDLGFLTAGRLAVSGRLKDMLVLRGENLPPADVEAAAMRVGGALVTGGVAAIGVNRDGTQALVVVAEVRSGQRPPLDDLRRRMREAVSTATGHVPEDIVLVNPASLPRTTSGKLQRSRITALYESGGLLAAFDREPAAPLSHA